MTASPENAPVTRRQARETQQTVGAPPEAVESTEAEAPRRRRASTTEPVAGGNIPDVAPQQDAPAPSAPVTPAAPAAASSPAPSGTSTGGMTRRQLRELERTGSLERPVLTPVAPPVEEVAPPVALPPRQTPVAPKPSAPAKRAPKPAPSKPEPIVPPKQQAAKAAVAPTGTPIAPVPPVVPADATPSRPRETVAGTTTAAGTTPSAMPTVAEQATGGRAAEPTGSIFDVSDRDDISEDPASTLSKGFGRDSMLVAALEAEKAQAEQDVAFEELLGAGITATGSVTTSSLIIPVAPEQATPGATSNTTGEILITGSIELPRGLGASGQDPNHFDGADVDKLFESDEMPASVTAASPVSASKAVSSHGNARDVVPATTNQSNKLLMTLAIAAAVLAAGVLAVLVIGYFSGAF
ncbi:hypothetical protein [Plantibacter sp. YIM 135249]|uniref:hypothetical protein n=1 Tax=Plantibacter sp. YIM 135249 TaxID=3423918 RepID=UPI003D3516E8